MLFQNSETHKIFSYNLKDILINHTGNGTTGRLYNRFRYLRKLDRVEKSKQTEQINTSSSDTQITNAETARINAAPVEDLLYLKTAVVSPNTMDEIRQKLITTREKRDEMVKDDSLDYLEHFPFFFACPTLVSILLVVNLLFQQTFLVHSF